MFTAYFDASGKRQQSVLTVSGFVSDVRKWSKFDAEWDAILMAEGLNCFHMTDFVARKKPYGRWGSGYSEPRDKFFRRLIETSVRHTNKSFANVSEPTVTS
jgi:hypothetical protein